MENSWKILIVDDQEMMAQSLQLTLQQQSNIAEVSYATSGKHALELLNETSFNVAIIDLEMPEMDGKELSRIIRKKYQELKIIVLTVNIRAEHIQDLFVKTQVNAYVPRYSGLEVLTDALEAVQHGERYIPEDLKPKLQTDSGFQKLTKREKEIIHLTAKGLTQKEVADQLVISDKTVRRHKDNIFEKLNVKNVAEMLRYYLQMKWLSTDSEKQSAPFKRIDSE